METSNALSIIFSVFFNVACFATILVVVGLLVHLINIGLVNKTQQKIVGLISVPMISFLLVWLFKPEILDNSYLAITIGIVFLVVGFFADILDDIARDIFNGNPVPIAIVLGLAWGITWITSSFVFDWKYIEGEVVDVASVSRVEIYRYKTKICTGEKSCGEDCTETYTYDCSGYEYYNYLQKINLSFDYSEMIEGTDYVLGYGDLSYKDKAYQHYFRLYVVGNQLEHKWLLALDPDLRLNIGGGYKISTNLFEDIKSASILSPIEKDDIKYVGSYKASLADAEKATPVPGELNRILVKGFSFFFKIFTDPAYYPLRVIYLILYITLVIVAIIFPVARQAVGFFIVSSLIVPFLIILIVSSRSGQSLNSFKFGGGDFGGGGAGSRW